MTDVIKELEQHLLALSPTEKVQVMQLLAHSLGNSRLGVEKPYEVSVGDVDFGIDPFYSFRWWNADALYIVLTV